MPNTGSLKVDPRWNANYEQHARQITGCVISLQNATLQASLAASRQAQRHSAGSIIRTRVCMYGPAK
jgi:hypothetical protein